jgi:NAD(P)H-dependent FMN reductase
VSGEYNWGVQPGLKNFSDHFLEEWFWRPAAIASYSGGRFGGVRTGLAWRAILAEMGMVTIPSNLAVDRVADSLDSEGMPVGGGGESLRLAFPRFVDHLMWWTQAARTQRERCLQPY